MAQDRLMTEDEIREHLKSNPLIMPTNENIKNAMAETVKDAIEIIKRYTTMIASKATLVNIVKLQASLDKSYLDALICEGFTREEALRIVVQSDPVLTGE